MIVSSNPRRARTAQYVLMFGYVVFLGFPLLWMLSMSFKGPRELVQLYPSLIPEDFTLENALPRFALVGDLWNPVLQGQPADLRAVLDRLGTR